MTQPQQPALSADGLWWWDGRAWRPRYAAPPPVPGPRQPRPSTSSRSVLAVVLSVVAAFVLLIAMIVGTTAYAVTRGDPSVLQVMQIGFHTAVERPEVWDSYVGHSQGRTTLVFRVDRIAASSADPQALLTEAVALQAIVNRYAPHYGGPVQVRFRQHRHVVATVTFGAHDTITVDDIAWR